MESVELSRYLFDIHNSVMSAKNLVDDGKEVLCSRRLQGAITRLIELHNKLRAENELATEVQSAEGLVPKLPGD